MEALETIKSKTQTSFTNLLEQAQGQPDEVKVWGVTAGSAVVGALAMTAAANGILAILATLASPPIALTVGAIGGGIAGWAYFNNRQTTQQPQTSLAVGINEEVTPIAVVAASAEVVEQIVELAITEEAFVETVALTPAENDSEAVAVEPIAVEPIAETADETVAPVAEEAVVAAIALTPAENSSEAVAETTNETVASVAADHLEAINGIGPVYAGRLQAAGVSTFTQLAQITPDQIREIIGSVRSGHKIEPEKWIVEARQLAEHQKP